MCWAAAAAGFVVFLLLPGFDDPVLQMEVGYTAAAVVLAGLLYAILRGELAVRSPSRQGGSLALRRTPTGRNRMAKHPAVGERPPTSSSRAPTAPSSSPTTAASG